MKTINLKNFKKEMQTNSHQGYYVVTAKDFIDLINDPNTKGDDNNPVSPIEIWPGQRDYRGKITSVKSIYTQIAKVPSMCFSQVTVVYDRDYRKYYLLDGQHRYRRFLALLNGEVPCPNNVYWAGSLVGRITCIDEDFPADFRMRIENAEMTMCIRNCSHSECKELFIALNENVVSLTQGDTENAERYEDEDWQHAKQRARTYYKDIIDDRKYICTRLLTSINAYMKTQNKTDNDIKILEGLLDKNLCELYMQIFDISMPSIADHNFTAFAYFYAKAWLNNKLALINGDTIEAIKEFYRIASDVIRGGITTHESVINFTNVRALTSVDSCRKRGDYIYDFIKYRNPNF